MCKFVVKYRPFSLPRHSHFQHLSLYLNILSFVVDNKPSSSPQPELYLSSLASVYSSCLQRGKTFNFWHVWQFMSTCWYDWAKRVSLSLVSNMGELSPSQWPVMTGCSRAIGRKSPPTGGGGRGSGKIPAKSPLVRPGSDTHTDTPERSSRYDTLSLHVGRLDVGPSCATGCRVDVSQSEQLFRLDIPSVPGRQVKNKEDSVKMGIVRLHSFQRNKIWRSCVC